MTAILGISAFYHDSAAAIVVDGKIVAAAQQERYSRIKHDPQFPAQAIEYCLASANLTLHDLDAVVFYDKPLLKFERLLETFLGNAPFGFFAFARAMPIWLKEKLYLKSLIRRELRTLICEHELRLQQVRGQEHDPAYAKAQSKKATLPPLHFTEHHQSHAASAFYPSPYDEAAVVCLDGVGEWATSSIWHGKANTLKPLKEMHFPHSIGLLYSAMTYYCGFRVNSGEYKLMGLAPYGTPKYVDLIKEHLIDILADGSFALNMRYFDYAIGSRMVNRRFETLFGGKAHPFDRAPTQKQMDLASSIQVVIEEVVLNIAREAKRLTKSKNLCLAGGVALNCVANSKILNADIFDEIWIQPAAGDAGGALGAALQLWYERQSLNQADKRNTEDSNTALANKSAAPSLKREVMQSAQLGDAFSKEEIVQVCEQLSLVFKRFESDELISSELLSEVSQALADDKVVGWFQGRMEFGPRALGNRSILGNPCSEKMQSQMNLKIKQRESFRPFAPAVLSEDAKQWFELNKPSPFMLFVANLNSQHRVDDSTIGSNNAHEQVSNNDISIEDRVNQVRSVVPAITHLDYSARVQTVDAQHHAKFHALISAFKQRTGVGMLINTSFNVRGEPPVRSPEDAIQCFLATEMDVLVMENIVLYKAEQANDVVKNTKRQRFAKD
ncbi:carbamoyltransferase [Ningiella sp. W23]|uniref:carbamoyltransferase family protein n=1 Tax=Ningiella sp. W23 TaxID=3023715 RepID=UPI003756AE0F